MHLYETQNIMKLFDNSLTSNQINDNDIGPLKELELMINVAVSLQIAIIITISVPKLCTLRRPIHFMSIDELLIYKFTNIIIYNNSIKIFYII